MKRKILVGVILGALVLLGARCRKIGEVKKLEANKTLTLEKIEPALKATQAELGWPDTYQYHFFKKHPEAVYEKEEWDPGDQHIWLITGTSGMQASLTQDNIYIYHHSNQAFWEDRKSSCGAEMKYVEEVGTEVCDGGVGGVTFYPQSPWRIVIAGNENDEEAGMRYLKTFWKNLEGDE